MHVKNHMAMWILWILWILWIDGLVSMPMPMPMPMLASCLARPLTRLDARPLALCGLLKRFAHRPDS